MQLSNHFGRALRSRFALATFAAVAFVFGTVVAAEQVVLDGAPGSQYFGVSVTLLPNGNFVVVDSGFDAPGPVIDAGAVYLYRPDGTQISVVYGASEGNHIGSWHILVLRNGNFVILSPGWDASPTAQNAGAVTFASGTTGISGVISAENSLVGSSSNDGASMSVLALTNGNYVARMPYWDNGTAVDAGAVAFGSGVTGAAGTISAGNALVGTKNGDNVGVNWINEVGNSNYVVRSSSWGNTGAPKAGAVTFGSGTLGIRGEVSAANSLVGTSADDRVGSLDLTLLRTGNYVVVSGAWDNGAIADAGAVTFGNGSTGVAGAVSAANSLVGASTLGASIISIDELTNGNFVVSSYAWSDGAVTGAGAVTFGSATTGVTGAVGPHNSIVGSSTDDGVALRAVLSNGNYVVGSARWDNGPIADVGAIALVSGTAGGNGLLSASNSLIGSTEGDQVGAAVRALSNGNYVVSSLSWDNGAVADVGAATFVSGTTGLTGVVSPANSLIGASPGDQTGLVTALPNGNYLVRSSEWDNGAAVDAGAVTFCSGTTGRIGVVSPENSLVGTTMDDSVGAGDFGIRVLSTGNYVVRSSLWDSPTAVNVGAATFGSGVTGISGPISATNSLVGETANDYVSNNDVVALANGNYVVLSASWDNGATPNAGAFTLGSGVSGITGPVSPLNSMVGSRPNDYVGGHGVTRLTNGHYVVRSSSWGDGLAEDVGAVTFGNGAAGTAGVVSASNSIVGTTTSDTIGSGGIETLAHGNYVIVSPVWDNGPAQNAGAITFGSGTAASSGVVSSANSLVGSTTFDAVGIDDPFFATDVVRPMSDGNYIVNANLWDNAGVLNAGAIALGLGDGGGSGALTAINSVAGLVASPQPRPAFTYDPRRKQLIVGQPASMRVVLHRPGSATTTMIIGHTPDPSPHDGEIVLTARVASSTTPVDGNVTFSAGNGATCTDNSPSASSADSADFSCTLLPASSGTLTIFAEYTGSHTHAYSRSANISHVVLSLTTFADGFEAP